VPAKVVLKHVATEDPVLASRARGFESFWRTSRPTGSLDHLNPQVQEVLIP
jgi:hypothetical protein